MTHKISIDDDTSELLQKLATLTGLPISDIVDRHLSAFLPEWHELLALVGTHPTLHEQAANLILSFGPEPLAAGIKRIAPPNYLTLGEQFEREMTEAICAPRTTH